MNKHDDIALLAMRIRAFPCWFFMLHYIKNQQVQYLFPTPDKISQNLFKSWTLREIGRHSHGCLSNVYVI